MINSRKVEDLHPRVRELCGKHIEACAKRGVRIIVTSTLRDQQCQSALYAQGRTKPGKIVTQVRLIGAHGFGLAYDVAPVSSDGKRILWNDNAKWKVIAEEGKRLGFKWGGDWKTINDKPHFELTEGLSYSELRAGRRPSWWKTEPQERLEIKVLRLGMIGKEVKLLQTLLNKNGFKVIVDGTFGSFTSRAVRSFQKQHGLTVDGVVGAETWKKLIAGQS